MKLKTLHSETTGTSPHFPQTFVEAEVHSLRPWSRPKFPQDMPRPNFPHLSAPLRPQSRPSPLRQACRGVYSLELVLGASQTTGRVTCLELRCSLICFIIRHAQSDFLDLFCRHCKQGSVPSSFCNPGIK